jgi:hypothetical protein
MVLVGWLALRRQRRAGSAQARVSHSL